MNEVTLATDRLLSAARPPQPYPGLRPFEIDEWSIFFGRERIIDEVIELLARQRLVVIHGSSGSGKSSLIRAGVLPRLARQHLRYDVPWRTITMRPSNGPLWNLATALAGIEGRSDDLALVETVRRAFDRREIGLQDIVVDMLGLAGQRVCMLIDQFEELFRYAREISRDESQLFIELLAGLTKDDGDSCVHAAITLRSEFLGECARYDGLAEVINSSQYLLPRMDKEGLLRAICRPAELYAGTIDEDLAERLVADAAGGQDELPLIQHAIMLLWKQASAKGDSPRRLGLDLFRKQEGGIAALLSDHADGVMAATVSAPSQQAVVEWLFRALTAINAEGQGIRRPQRFDRLVDVTGCNHQTLRTIINAFRTEGISFLTPYPSTPIEDATVIDISHEALIRCWRRIADPKDGWLQREFEDGLIWRSLLTLADNFEKNPKDVLSPALTEDRRRWLRGRMPAWCERYGGGWQRVTELIQASEEFAKLQRLYRLISILESDNPLEDRRYAARALSSLETVIPPGPVPRSILMTTFVPVLISALADADLDVRRCAAEVLKKIGPAAIPALIKALRDTDLNVRSYASRALGEIGPVAAEAVPALIEVLRDTNLGVRSSAAGALAKIGQEAIPYLIEALADADGDVRRYAEGTLVDIGPAAFPALIKALRDTDLNVRSSAARALGKIGPEAAPALIEALRDPDLSVRSSAAGALREIGQKAIPSLIEALADADRDVRRYAAGALGEIGPVAAEAVPALSQALRESELSVRSSAAGALSKIGQEAIPALIEALADADGDVRRYAARALGEIGKVAAEAVPALIKALRDTDSSVRSSAAEALGEIGPVAAEVIPALSEALRDTDFSVQLSAKTAIQKINESAEGVFQRPTAHGTLDPALIKALRDTDLSMRSAPAEALGEMGSVALPALIKALRHTELSVRSAAAAALGEIGPVAAEAIPALSEALRDSELSVRSSAAGALSKIGQEAIPALIEALADADGDVRRYAAGALGEIGEVAAEAVPALIKALRDTDSSVRSSAAGALGEIGPVAAEVIPALSEALRDTDFSVQLSAKTAIQKINESIKAVFTRPAAARSWPAHWTQLGASSATTNLSLIS